MPPFRSGFRKQPFRRNYGAPSGRSYPYRKPTYKSSYARPKPLSTIPSNYVKCIGVATFQEGVSPGCTGCIAAAIKLTDVTATPAFGLWSKRTERFCIKSMSIKIMNEGDNPLLMTYLDKDSFDLQFLTC